MQQPKSVIPSVISVTLALLIIGGIGYFFYSDTQLSRQEHTLTPPIEVIDPEPAITVIHEETELPAGEEIIEQEANDFVGNLVPETAQQHLAINDGQGIFIRNNGKIILPELEKRKTSIEALLADKTFSDDTALTVEYIDESRTTTNLNDLKNSTEDHTAPITIETAEGNVITAPLADISSQYQLDANSPITLIEKKAHQINTTIAELASIPIDKSKTINATITLNEQALAIDEITANNADIPKEAILYLHRVSEADVQGLWGIIQAGLIDKFRQGISLEGISRNNDLVQVTIPHDADEKLPSGLSSFLGKLLSNKVDSTYIYNYKTKVMGFDPNIIHPGQQLILIHFAENELKDVYQFFSKQRNKNVETFAVN